MTRISERNTDLKDRERSPLTHFRTTILIEW